MCVLSTILQLDPKALPPIITNQVMRKQVMAVRYVKEILTPSLSPFPSPRSGRRKKKNKKQGSTASLPHIHIVDEGTDPTGQSGETPSGPSGNGTADSIARFEDPVSVYAFIHSSKEIRRMESVPWDMYHHWEGDDHSHTHLEAVQASPRVERSRSYSEGESAGFHSAPVLQPTLMQQIVEDSEGKGQVT